ncbi:unnamed protein product [Hapterophycus canaliculatus]
MVTKHVPALTSSGSGSSTSSADGGASSSSSSSSLRQICNAVGPPFVHRLLRTPGDKVDGEGDGGSAGGLSVYQQIALGVLAAFFRDDSLAQKFLPVAPALVRALRAANAVTQTQGLCDALYCAQALAAVPGGIERLLRAGAAPAVVSRLSAASGDRAGERAARLNEKAAGDDGVGGKSVGGSGGVEETKTGGGGEIKEDSSAAATAAAARLRSSPKGLGAGNTETARAGGDGVEAGHGGGEQAGPAERAEALAFAFVGRAIEASGGNCLGSRELTAVAEAFRDDPTSAKFGFMDLLLRWASLQEDGGTPRSAAGGGAEGGVATWTKRGPFPAALREGLLQALHGAAEDERRDSALALLASLLRALGQEWAVEEDDGGGVGGGRSNGAKAAATAPKRKRGTFVAFAVRCAAGEVRILLDEALSLLVPAAARGGAGGCGGGEGEEETEEDDGRAREKRWDELPIDTLQDLQKTLVGLFGCVLDFFSEIRRWIVAPSPQSGGGGGGRDSPAAVPSIVDLWAMQKLGLQCSRVLGMWVAEDSESLPQRFLEALPVLLALRAGEEIPDSDDEESDEEEEDGGPNADMAPALQAFPGTARFIAADTAGGGSNSHADPAASASTSASATRADEALHHVLRAMLALSYEAAPLAAMVEEGVTARLARLAAAGPPAIAALLGRGRGRGESGGGTSPSGPSPPPPEQVAEAVRSPLITACGLLTNILTSAGHLAWPEGGKAAPSHPVLGHPGMGECLASLAEVAGEAGAARRSGGGARWRLVVAHATLVVMIVARAAAPGNGLAPAPGLADRRPRWSGQSGSDHRIGGLGPPSASSVWDEMARAVDEALGSLSLVPGRGLIGAGGRDEDEEASYEEGSIWQWCLECAREMEAASGGATGNPYVSGGLVPRRVLKSLMEASSDGRI